MFKKIGKGLKKIVTAIPRLAIKKTLPKSAPFFLYTFITDPRVLAKLPSTVAIKKGKGEKYKKILIDKLGLKPENFESIVRNGIMSALGDTPENVIAKWMKEQNFSVGIIPIVVGAGKALFGLVKKLAGKAAEGLQDDVQNFSPAPEDWGAGAVDPQTATQQQNSGGGGSITPTGGGDYNYDHGDGDAGNTANLDSDGALNEDTAGGESEKGLLPEATGQTEGGGLGMLLIAGAGIMMLAGGKKGKK